MLIKESFFITKESKYTCPVCGVCLSKSDAKDLSRMLEFKSGGRALIENFEIIHHHQDMSFTLTIDSTAITLLLGETEIMISEWTNDRYGIMIQSKEKDKYSDLLNKISLEKIDKIDFVNDILLDYVPSIQTMFAICLDLENLSFLAFR
jgi:hypothetical protein